MPHALSSRAAVRTATPERYAKQLVEHLGHRVAFTTEGAEAADQQTLDRVQDVLGRHLERFGRRAELEVVWEPAAG